VVEPIGSLLATMVVVAAAPIVVGIRPGKIPQVVVLIAGGIVIGPEVLGVASPDDIALFANLGLGFLFLLAGYELEPHLLPERAGTLAIVAWVISIVLSIGVVALLASAGLVRAFVPVAIGLTTTALGTLLPILRERGLDRGPFGRYVFAAGAIGEMGPVLAIALLLGTCGSLVEVLGVAAVAGVALVLSVIPRLIRGTRVERIVARGEHETSQTTLRLTVLLLVLLLFLSARFGLDVVLGAFFAGMVLRRWHPGDVSALERKLDAVGYGFFIPVFFVSSGMGLDVDSIAQNPGRLLGFFVLTAGGPRRSGVAGLPPRSSLRPGDGESTPSAWHIESTCRATSSDTRLDSPTTTATTQMIHPVCTPRTPFTIPTSTGTTTPISTGSCRKGEREHDSPRRDSAPYLRHPPCTSGACVGRLHAGNSRRSGPCIRGLRC